MAGQIRLVGLRPTPLDVAEVLAAVADDAAGGLALFVGTVRDHDEGKAVTALGYSAHPHAEVQLREVAERVVRNHPVVALAAVHRVGQLGVADLAVVVAENADFPEPTVVLNAGAVWEREAVEAWAERVGRPVRPLS